MTDFLIAYLQLTSEQALAREWQLEERVPLPCWGDTADDLTVWRRRASAPPHGAPANSNPNPCTNPSSNPDPNPSTNPNPNLNPNRT